MMNLFHKYIATAVLFLSFVLSGSVAKAADESYVNILKGRITAGDSCVVVDDKFAHLPLLQWNMIRQLSVDNIITFDIRKDTALAVFNKPFTCTLTVKLKYFTSRDQQEPAEQDNIQLVVRYDTTTGSFSQVSASHRFKDAYKVVVIVKSISSKELGDPVPAFFRIRNQIQVKRKYPFTADVQAPVTMNRPVFYIPSLGGMLLMGSFINGQITDNVLDVSWNPADFSTQGFTNGPEEYDVEWAYFDYESTRGATIRAAAPNGQPTANVFNGMLYEWMERNNTRVVTASSQYKINLHYNQGYLAVRVRGASFDEETGLRTTTYWQYATVDGNANCFYVAGQSDQLNWQYTATYAEDAKRKEVITYFDGAFKERQVVTLDNQNEKALVSEPHYDAMDRPVMTLLPAAIEENRLKFYDDFTLDATGVPYSFQNINLPSAGLNCFVTAAPLHANSRSAKYYSPQNPFLNSAEYLFASYIPQAYNKPYALTEYTSDGTGRISKQGGVGPDFQPGSGKETRYFYGKPLQGELYRLFGMEAGDASHYLKNMVADANGQVSVSYLNASGKTIATALAGNNPAHLDALQSASTGIRTFNEVLITENDLQVSAAALEKSATATFLVAAPGTFTVSYSISPASLVTSPAQSAAFCTNCSYKVRIELRDNCGLLVNEDETNAFSGTDISCGTAQPVTGQFSNELLMGEYAVHFSLQLDEALINTQTEYYLTHNTDLKQLQAFFEEELSSIDLLACFSDCSDCMEKLGQLADFKVKVEAQLLLHKVEKFGENAPVNINAPGVQAWITNTYNTLLANCTNISANCMAASPCGEKLQMLKRDVFPGGQYAIYDPVNFTIPATETAVSIFLTSGSNALHYKNDPQIPNHAFLDAAGNTKYIKDAGVTLQEFIQAYLQHPEWADDFVKRHIEYCSYLWCSGNASVSNSFAFDRTLQEKIADGSTAVAKGLFSRSNFKALLDANKDPFFAPSGAGYSYRNAMINDLQQFSVTMKSPVNNGAGTPLQTKNILQYIDWMLYCRPSNSNATVAEQTAAWNSCTVNTSCRSITKEWELYRNYYLQLKSKYVALRKKEMVPDCENCFIGQDVATTTGAQPCDVSSGSAGYCPSIETDFEYEYLYETNSTGPIGGGSVEKDIKADVTLHYTGPVLSGPVDLYIKTVEKWPNGGCENANLVFEDEYIITMYPGDLSIYLGEIIHKYIYYEPFDCIQEGGFIKYLDRFLSNIVCVNNNSTSVPSNCTSDPRYLNYGNKQRVFNEYVNTQAILNCVTLSAPSTYIQQSTTALRDQVTQELVEMKAVWTDKLKAVRDEEGFAVSDAAITNIVNGLYQVSLKYITTATDVAEFRIVSTLPSGMVSSGNHSNFEQVFRAYLGNSLVEQGFGPHLLEYPFPYDVKPVLANTATPDISSTVCSNLSAITTRFTGAGGNAADHTALHAYMKQQLGDDFMLTVPDLSALIARCSSGCTVVDDPITLPVALSSARSYIDCAAFASRKNDFETLYSSVTAGTRLYRVLLTNFMNQHFGMGLSYEEYESFTEACGASTAAVLYNRPAQSNVVQDDYRCMDQLLSDAMDRAGNAHLEYIAIERIRFRNELVAKCLSNKAFSSIAGEQKEYHYTLYYYDQAGNLVKTVPPEGVQLLSDEAVAQIYALKAVPEVDCSNELVPHSENLTATLNTLSTALTDGSLKSIEWWLKNNPASPGHITRLVTPDHRYIVQAATGDGKFWADVFSLTPNGNQIDIVLTNHYTGVLDNAAATQEWLNVVLQSAGGLTQGALEIYVNGKKLAAATDGAAGYPFEWEISSSSNGYAVPSNESADIKHIRFYRRTATAQEILANYNSPCLAPAGLLGQLSTLSPSNIQQYPLLLWTGLNAVSYCSEEEANVLEATNNAALDVVVQPNYLGAHITEVANNFTIEFWAKPLASHQIDAESQSGFAGTDGQKYAIFPVNTGGSNAGVGVSVGTNGVSVYEHSDGYMPALLTWQGTITGWVHIAVTYVNKRPSLYINGVLARQGLISPRANVYPSYALGGGGYGGFTGRLDEFRIWNTVRTPEQLQQFMLRGIAPSEATGLVGYWPVSATDGQSMIKDNTCNARNIPFSPTWFEYQTDKAPVTDVKMQERTVPFIVPNHRLSTTYVYNSLNQVIRQHTPDAGESTFFYDRLGRLTVSQNAEQKQPEVADTENPPNRFSYTRYDQFGRITEVGEKVNAPFTMTENDARNPTQLTAWLSGGNNRQVTLTYYDVVPQFTPPSLAGLQFHLRKRVVATALLDAASPNANPEFNRASAIYYSYDYLGNVRDLWQENTLFAVRESQAITSGNRLKHLRYEYDLVSGKVNKVLYQPGKWDQFFYHYQYDRENRVISAWSSRTNGPLPVDNTDPNWTREAEYKYHYHGPLARVQLGRNNVQGIDYAYTLQGWLKGVNGQKLDPSKDMMGDGTGNFSGFARDAYAFSLGYFAGDYQPIGNTASAFNTSFNSTTAAAGANLYNGNIGHATYAIKALDASATHGFTYRYDQLNRITQFNSHGITENETSWSNNATSKGYKEQFTYDANGNIETLKRYGQDGNLLDDLLYNYGTNSDGQKINNKLLYLDDAISNGTSGSDLKDQLPGNYVYDKIGNLIKDHDITNNIQRINWTVYGKIASIHKANGTVIAYKYDPSGNRISKTVTPSGATAKTTFYVRDAQGNTLSVYESDNTALTWKEQHLYGSSRLGMALPELKIQHSNPFTNDLFTSVTSDPLDNGIEGKRRYELTNHLGNVMAVVSDRKRAGDQGDEAELLSVQQYYAFGMLMEGRNMGQVCREEVEDLTEIIVTSDLNSGVTINGNDIVQNGIIWRGMTTSSTLSYENQAIKMVNGGGTSDGATAIIPLSLVQPNTTYVVEFDVARISGDIPEFLCQVHTSGFDPYRVTAIKTADGRYSLTFTTPATIPFLRLRISARPTNAGASFYVDNFVLRKVPGATVTPVYSTDLNTASMSGNTVVDNGQVWNPFNSSTASLSVGGTTNKYIEVASTTVNDSQLSTDLTVEGGAQYILRFNLSQDLSDKRVNLDILAGSGGTFAYTEVRSLIFTGTGTASLNFVVPDGADQARFVFKRRDSGNSFDGIGLPYRFDNFSLEKLDAPLQQVNIVCEGEEESGEGGYRYGFNGKENDNEVKGTGNQQDYGMRIYDPRIGRFLSVDPLIRSYPMLTPYQFASNSLIGSIDLDGEESKVIVHTYGTDKTTPLFTPTTYVDNSIIAQEGVHYEVHHFKKINDGKVVGTTTCNYVVDDNTGEKLFLFGGLQAARNIMSSPFSPIKKNSEAGKMRDVDLGDEVPFVSQFTLPRPQVACCRASQQIIKNFGIPSAGAKSSRFIIGRENADKNAITPTSQAASGIEYINKQLEGGNPIMVGLNHTFGKGQGDGEAADHFVVIVGRFYDKSKKQYYFNFLEVGTSSEDNGRSDENRLYINKDNTITGTNYAGRRNFTVTDIRKNE